jgi:hypothetical protein
MRSSYIWEVTFDDDKGTILRVVAACAGEATEVALAAYSLLSLGPVYPLTNLRRRQAIHYRA